MHILRGLITPLPAFLTPSTLSPINNSFRTEFLRFTSILAQVSHTSAVSEVSVLVRWFRAHSLVSDLFCRLQLYFSTTYYSVTQRGIIQAYTSDNFGAPPQILAFGDVGQSAGVWWLHMFSEVATRVHTGCDNGGCLS